jgi:hypothetical protein
VGNLKITLKRTTDLKLIRIDNWAALQPTFRHSMKRRKVATDRAQLHGLDDLRTSFHQAEDGIDRDGGAVPWVVSSVPSGPCPDAT